jgi:hypothetical protein
MVPQIFIYPLAAIGISGIYAAWHRMRLSRVRGTEHELRERVTYMLWVAASRF